MARSVLFVCLGNICRSPTAEAVFRLQAKGRGLVIDSAGTSGWHDGHPSDARASAEAIRRGVDMSYIRSRKVTTQDFYDFDLIVAMDGQNMQDLRAAAPEGSTARLVKLLDYAPGVSLSDVPDPYFEDNFSEVIDMIEIACAGLLKGI
ncbi:MAG: low molecular weight phosphotyrosine protein phosphatase [Rhodobacteraceae bacterium]|nr:low molecular weight phosphotyrosine protein phosphatase [Paracoccaceae bacterium]